MLLCSHATVALPDPLYATVLPVHNPQRNTHTHTHTHTHFYTVWKESAVPQDSLHGYVLSKQCPSETGSKGKKRIDRKLQ